MAYNNRLDTTLADVFSLLSLFYLTIGKTRDTPATYSQIASMRVRAGLRCLCPADALRSKYSGTWTNRPCTTTLISHRFADG